MKKRLIIAAALLCCLMPLAADENWVGINIGPGFEFQKHGESDEWHNETDLDLNVDAAFYLNDKETMGIGAALGFDWSFYEMLGETETYFTFSPAVTFQYRHEINRDMELRFGAGLQYLVTTHSFGVINDYLSGHTGSIGLVANADYVYRIDDFGISLGLDFAFPFYTYQNFKGEMAGITVEDSGKVDVFNIKIAPRIGVSYYF